MATKTSLLGLTKPAYTEAADIAVLNTNFDLIDKAVGNGARVHNLLDNSWFADPINQRGLNNTSANWNYFIDRWMLAATDATPVYFDVNSAYRCVGFSTTTGADVYLVQRSPLGVLTQGKLYTWAYETLEGAIYSGVVGGFEETSTFTQFVVQLKSHTYLKWIALYEGEYDTAHLPAYVHKGYAAELAECQRYFLPLNHQLLGNGYTFSGGAALLIPCKMRIHIPSFNSSDTIMTRVNGKDYSLTQSAISTYGSMIKVDFAGDVPANYPCAFYSSGASASLSADL